MKEDRIYQQGFLPYSEEEVEAIKGNRVAKTEEEVTALQKRRREIQALMDDGADYRKKQMAAYRHLQYHGPEGSQNILREIMSHFKIITNLEIATDEFTDEVDEEGETNETYEIAASEIPYRWEQIKTLISENDPKFDGYLTKVVDLYIETHRTRIGTTPDPKLLHELEIIQARLPKTMDELVIDPEEGESWQQKLFYNARYQRMEEGGHAHYIEKREDLYASTEEELEEIFGTDGPPQEWFSDPQEDKVEALEEEIGELQNRIEWLELQLSHYRRVDGEKVDGLTRVSKQFSNEKFPSQKSHHVSHQKNIDLLQEMQLDGHRVDVVFSNYDDHVKRDLCVRYGIDLENRTRVKFRVSHYSHLNNYYGHLDGHPTKKVCLGLKLNSKNKVNLETPDMNTFRCSTALRPYDEGDRYLELELKYLPGGVGFSKYTRQDLLDAHVKIMAELYGEK